MYVRQSESCNICCILAIIHGNLRGIYYVPINIMPHYPPPGQYRGQYRGIDIENQAQIGTFDIHVFRTCQIPYCFPTLEGGWSGGLTDEAGPTLWEVDEFISQIPTLPLWFPGKG